MLRRNTLRGHKPARQVWRHLRAASNPRPKQLSCHCHPWHSPWQVDSDLWVILGYVP